MFFGDTPPKRILGGVFLESRFSTDFSAPRRVWKKLSNKKKVVNVVDGEGA